MAEDSSAVLTHERRSRRTARSTARKPPPYSLDPAVLAREVEIETFRATGAGGQHVNKTNSALRLRHSASGVVVIARDSPSQFRNREIAFGRLIERLRKLNEVRRKRVATRPTRASKERRLVTKKRTGAVKQLRRKVEQE